MQHRWNEFETCPIPDCGEAPAPHPLADHLVRCSNEECCLFSATMTHEAWQSLPRLNDLTCDCCGVHYGAEGESLCFICSAEHSAVENITTAEQRVACDVCSGVGGINGDVCVWCNGVGRVVDPCADCADRSHWEELHGLLQHVRKQRDDAWQELTEIDGRE